MPTLATLIKILSTSLWAHFKSFGCFIEKNQKQVFSGHCLGSTSAGEKKKKEKQQQSAAFPLLRKSRAGEFLAGTFKRACMMVIKRQDLK